MLTAAVQRPFFNFGSDIDVDPKTIILGIGHIDQMGDILYII